MFQVDWTGAEKYENAKRIPMLECIGMVKVIEVVGGAETTLDKLLMDIFIGRPLLVKTLDGLEELQGITTYGDLATEVGYNGFLVTAIYGGVAIHDRMNHQGLLISQDYEATFQRSMPSGVRAVLSKLVEASENAGEPLELAVGLTKEVEDLKRSIDEARKILSMP